MSHRPEVPSPCQGPGCNAASLLRLVPAPAGHRLCGSSVVQGLWPDGGTAPAPHWRNNERRSEKASEKPVKLPNTSFPWAYHGGLEGRAGECDSCRFSLCSGSRRDPIVCATSWNTDLSRLSQSEGSLRGRRQIRVLPVSRFRPGLPHHCLCQRLSPVRRPGFPLSFPRTKEVSPFDAASGGRLRGRVFIFCWWRNRPFPLSTPPELS